LNRTLLAIGFRPFYLLASVFAVAAILFWLAGFNGRLPVGAYLQGVFWHSHEMLFGYIVAVMAGFLFTAVRNWTGLPTPSGVTLGGIVLLWILARVLLVSGPSALAVILDVAFLPMIAIAVAIPILRSRNKRNYKIIGVLVAVSLLHFVFHMALGGQLPSWLSRASLFASIDLVVILFALVGGRVIPAFTRNAVAGSDPRHENWLEVIAFGSLLVIVLVTLLGGAFTFAAWVPTSLFIVAAVAHLLRLALWQPQVTLGNPLLWMMPVAYSWLPAALLLRALSTVAVIVPGAWIHALTMGALSSLMMAMMMRSTLGHTGRKLVASQMDILAFLLLQLAALLRVVAGAVGNYQALVVLSGVVWMLAFALFVVRYLPMLVQPRVDGKPG
jgi:uncharacterized protein involved in response to NO